MNLRIETWTASVGDGREDSGQRPRWKAVLHVGLSYIKLEMASSTPRVRDSLGYSHFHVNRRLSHTEDQVLSRSVHRIRI